MSLEIPTITPLPTPVPQRSDPANFAARADAFHAALPAFGTETNAAIAKMNEVAALVEAYDALVNFKGAWGGLTGALAMPASVSHSGNIYALTADVADVTAHTPGVSASWQLVRATTAQITHGSATLSEALGAGYRGDRNLILNGGFEIRQDAETTAIDGGYLFDVFYALTETGSVGVSRLTHPEAGAPYALRLTQPDASPKRFGFAQAIPSGKVGRFRTMALHLAARLRLSAAGNIRYAILEHTGTADSITRDVVNNWASTSFTASGFFIAGVTVLKTGVIAPGAATFGGVDDWSAIGASANNLIVAIWTESAQAQNVTLDCARIQLEPGVVETPHAWRDDELRHVRFIYEKQTLSFGDNAWTASATHAQWQPWVPKRIASPAISLTAGSLTNTAAPTYDSATDSGARILHVPISFGAWSSIGFVLTVSARL